MITSGIDSNLSFRAKIRVNKINIEKTLLNNSGSSSVSSGVSTISTGSASGADMMVHGSESAVPVMQNSSSLFDQLAQIGHKILNTFMKNPPEHNGYDASFYSTSLTGSGALTYAQGMNNIVKGIDKTYKNKKIPT